MVVVQLGFGVPAADGAEVAACIEADPFSDRPAQEVDGQIRVDEAVTLEIEHRADAVAGIGDDRDALVDTGHFVVQQGVAHAEPDGAGPMEEVAARHAHLDQVRVAQAFFLQRKGGRLRVLQCCRSHGQWVARQAPGNLQVLLAVDHCREARDFLAAGRQLCREMADVAASVVGRHREREIADRQRAQQIGGDPGDVRQSALFRRNFNRAARQRDRRTGVLVVGIPQTAGQGTGAKGTAVQQREGAARQRFGGRSQHRSSSLSICFSSRRPNFARDAHVPHDLPRSPQRQIGTLCEALMQD